VYRPHQAIKPPASQKNKYPGSTLRYIYNTTTVYEFAGANYMIDTQVRPPIAWQPTSCLHTGKLLISLSPP
jgi:hypothetical protein